MAELIRPLTGADAERCADALLRRFSSLAGVLAADPVEVQRAAERCEGIGACIATVRATMLCCLHEELTERPVLSTYAATTDYLRTMLAHDRRETVAALFLDGANRLLAAETVAIGTVDQVALYPREVCKRALDLGAVSLILGHNHPGGSLKPSDEDVAATRALIAAAAALGITVHDHIIVSPAGWSSMRAAGAI